MTGSVSISGTTNSSIDQMNEVEQAQEKMTVKSLEVSCVSAQGSVIAGTGEGVRQTSGAAGQACAAGARPS